MEGNILTTIQLEQIHPERPFCVRYQLRDEELTQAVKACGVITPILVTKETPHIVVSGHKRIEAAKEAGLSSVPAIIMGKIFNRKEAFLLAVLSNTGHTLDPLDDCLLVRAAIQQYGFSAKEVREDLLSYVCRDPERRNVENLLKTALLHPLLLKAVATGRLAIRGVHVLSRFTMEDQKIFAEQLASRLRFSSSHLVQAAEWLSELMKQQKASLLQILQSEGLQEIAEDSRIPDERQRTELFVKRLRASRFRKLVLAEEEFKRHARLIEKELPGVSIRAPAGFEAEGVNLQVRVKDPNHLEEVIAKLKVEQTSLNALMKTML